MINDSTLYSGEARSLLNEFDQLLGIQRPLGRIQYDDGSMLSPIPFHSIAVSGNTAYCTVQNGNVLAIQINNSSSYWRSKANHYPTSSVQLRSQHEIGMMTFVPTPLSLLCADVSGLYLETDSKGRQLRNDSISAADWRKPNAMFCGFRKLFVSQDSGMSCTGIPAPLANTTFEPVISSIVSGKNGHFVSLRGYRNEAEGAELYRVEGGLYHTTNQGVNWTKVALPTNDAWVESLIQNEDGVMFCWTTSYLWETFSGIGTMRYDNWHLLRSDDGGMTWTESTKIQRNYVPAKHGAWRISANSSTVVANTDSEVLVSYNNGDTWKIIEDIPYGTFVTGSAVDSLGSVWMSTEIGIYVHSKTSAVEDASVGINSKIELSIFPNPNNGTFVIASTSDENNLNTAIESISVTNALGKQLNERNSDMVLEFLQPNTVRVALPDLTTGVYVVTVWCNGKTRSSVFCVVKP